MPQQKKTEGFDGLDQDVLDSAGPGDREFALLLCKGETGAEAYRRAFPENNLNQNALWVEASRLKNAPKVRLWVDAYRLAGLQRGKRTLEEHIGRLTELGVKAELTGNYGAAVNAEHHCGKVSDLYTEKHKVEVDSPQEMLAQLANLLGVPPESLQAPEQDSDDDQQPIGQC